MAGPRVTSIRRYPVKAMGGEPLQAVDVDARGLVGDRWFAVVDEDGRLAAGKTSRRFRRHDEVFAYAAATAGEDVVVTRAGERWTVGDPALDEELGTAFGAPVRVLPEGGVQHQDAGQVSLVGTATLAWCADRWGIDPDPRRLRVNLLVATDEPFVEESWTGSALTVGGAHLRVVQRIDRCRTIDVAQDGAEARGPWLRHLAAERDLFLAVYADVATPGRIEVGDEVVGG